MDGSDGWTHIEMCRWYNKLPHNLSLAGINVQHGFNHITRAVQI